MKKIIISIILLVIIANLILFQSSTNLENVNDAFFIYFHIHNVNLNITFSICFMLLLGYSVVEDCYIDAHNKFDRLCIQRIGYKKYYIKNIFKIINKTIIFKLLFEVLFVLTILIRGMKINFTYDMTMLQQILSFNDNILINFIAYLIISTIGTCILSVFLFSIIDVVRNRYIFKIIIPLFSLSVFVVSNIISPILYKVIIPFIHEDGIARTLLSLYNPINLIEPGSEWASWGYLSLFSSGLFFIIISIVFIKMTINRREIYG